MDEAEREKYIELIASMSVDCLAGGITWKTYIANMNLIMSTINDKEGA